MELPHQEATLMQVARVLMTHVPFRSVSFAAPGLAGCRDPCTLSEMAAAELASSPEALAASSHTLEVRSTER